MNGTTGRMHSLVVDPSAFHAAFERARADGWKDGPVVTLEDAPVAINFEVAVTRERFVMARDWYQDGRLPGTSVPHIEPSWQPGSGI